MGRRAGFSRNRVGGLVGVAALLLGVAWPARGYMDTPGGGEGCTCAWEDLVGDRVPVERLDRLFDARLADRPDDGEAQLASARLHLNAFSLRTPASPSTVEAEAEATRLAALIGARRARAERLVAGRAEALDARCAAGADLPCDEFTGVDRPCCDVPSDDLHLDAREEHWRRLVDGGVAIVGWCATDCLDDAALAHAAEARRRFVDARRLRPADPLPRLGLAVLDAQLHGALVHHAGPRPPELADSSLQAAVDGFAAARVLARAGLIAAAAAPGGERLDAQRLRDVGGEAARWLVAIDQLARVLRATPADDDPAWAAVRSVAAPPRALADAQALLEAEAQRVRDDDLDLLKRLSPLVLHLDPGAGWDDVEAPDRTVAFDLDGDTVAERWTWVRPDAGFLVWDPEARGRIRSGRQLFGEVTWWVLFDDGYAALASLDADGDRRLAGPELDGVRVWFDADSDGVSTPAEVRDLAALGVVALATDGAHDGDGRLAHPAGATLADGSTRPTFDWYGARR